MNSDFRVFSGWDHRQAEAAEVFAYSVREASGLETTFLKAIDLPILRLGRTEFTYTRFLAPFLCGFRGRALFADGCDMLCLADLRELAGFDMRGRPIGVVKHPPAPGKEHIRPRSWTSLMLMDCEQLRWPPEWVETAADDVLMRLSSFLDDDIADLPPEWNVLVPPGEEPPPGTKIAHWTALSDPNGDSWVDRSGSKVWAEARRRWLAE